MRRGQFTFYRSFWEAMKTLPKKDQLPFVTAVCSYVFEEEERPLTGAAAAAFLLVRPVLDTAKRRAESGQLGGQAKPKQSGSEREQKKEQELEGELEEEYAYEGDGEKAPSAPAPRNRETDSAPSLPQVLEAAARMGCPEIARTFYDYYAVAGWRDSEGRLVLDWRQKLVAWRARAAENPRRPLPQERGGQKKSWAALAAELDGEA